MRREAMKGGARDEERYKRVMRGDRIDRGKGDENSFRKIGRQGREGKEREGRKKKRQDSFRKVEINRGNCSS